MVAQLVEGETIDGRYVLHGQLGRGGMATVYQALDLDLDLSVVLKVLPAQLARDPSFVMRFQREGQTLARLTHPNIVRLYSIGRNEQDNLYYLVLEHLPGGTLKARQGNRPWSLDQVVAVLRPVALAVDFAHHHESPVVHRDLKPANIMFGDRDRVVVCDFGLARMLEPDGGKTRSNDSPWGTLTADSILGTPEYMAPEQAEGSVPTSAVDRYALGVIAYELLVGSVPYRADTPRATLMQILTNPLPLPSRVNRDIDRRVENVLLKALAKDPDRRYGSAVQMVESLAAADTRIHAVPGTSPGGAEEGERRDGFERQRRLVFAGLAMLLAMLVIGAGVVSQVLQNRGDSAAQPTVIPPAPTRVSGPATAAAVPTVLPPVAPPADVATRIATAEPTAPPTSTPAPSATPAIDQRWGQLQPALDRAWGSSDWPATISMLDEFLSKASDYQPALDKLYSALVISGKQLIAGGATEEGVGELERADKLDPSRADAAEALLALTPVATDTPTPRPVATVPRVRPTTVVAVVPTATPPKPGFTPPPLPTKPSFTPPAR